MDMQLFLGALGKRWWALLSSAVLSLLGLYALATGKTTSWVVWVSFAAAVAMLLVASALAWNDEHKRTLVLESEVEKLKLVPAQLRITSLGLFDYDSPGRLPERDIFLLLKVELLRPLEVAIERDCSVELSFEGLIEMSEARNVAGKWKLYDRVSSTVPSQPLTPLPASLRSGHPAEGWVHFVTTRKQYELEECRMTLFVHTSRGDGSLEIPCTRRYWSLSQRNFIMPELGDG
jgi:hypothetical protein